jgi:hypothetical protein
VGTSQCHLIRSGGSFDESYRHHIVQLTGLLKSFQNVAPSTAEDAASGTVKMPHRHPRRHAMCCREQKVDYHALTFRLIT